MKPTDYPETFLNSKINKKYLSLIISKLEHSSLEIEVNNILGDSKTKTILQVYEASKQFSKKRNKKAKQLGDELSTIVKECHNEFLNKNKSKISNTKVKRDLKRAINLKGEKFLHKSDSKLHLSEPVEREQTRLKKSDEKTSQDPSQKISDFLDLLKKTHMSHHDDPRVIERLKKYYHNEYIIKPENVPQSYWNSHAKIMVDEGRLGDFNELNVKIETHKTSDGKTITNYIFPEKIRKEQIEILTKDQQSSLNSWLDYFISKDSDSFPMWAKYWAFNGMVKLSTFDKETQSFGRRTKETVAPFPDLNREVLAKVVDLVVDKIEKEKISEDLNDELKSLLNNLNFGKLYAHVLTKIVSPDKELFIDTTGEWVKYPKGSDPTPLVKSLEGHSTGWCTAAYTTARKQLNGGDFYVYYSNDKKGKPRIPRAAIRMENSKIAEVRGVDSNQNLDNFITGVVDSKLNEFGSEGDKYKLKVEHMKKLTSIYNKYNLNSEITKEELRFIYEIDGKIQGFGYNEDPRIKEIKQKRNIRKDLSYVLDCTEEEISLTKDEALKGNIKFHNGDLKLGDLTSAEGLELPKMVGGDLDLRGLTSAEGLELPKMVGGSLYLDGLTSTYDLELPKSIGGSLSFDGLTSAYGLELPKSIGGGLNLSHLTSTYDLELPKSIVGDLDLRGLTSVDGLELPETLGGSLNLSSLTSTDGLKLPKTLGRGLYLNSLTSAYGLELPESIGGDLNLSNLTSGEGLKLPKSIVGDLNLSNLTSAYGLELPETVGRYLDLHRLRSVAGLKLPTTIGGNINLGGLTSVEDLELSENIKSYVYLSKTISKEKNKLSEKYPLVSFIFNQ